MNQKKIKLIIFLSLSAVYLKGYSQVSTLFYANESHSKVAVGYQFNDKWWSDLRIYSGTTINNVTPEIVLNYNFLRKENYEIYFGARVIFNNINGIVIPIGIGIKPFKSVQNLSLNIEFNPLYELDWNDLFIRGFIGIRYKLK